MTSTASRQEGRESARRAFYETLRPSCLAPLWEVLSTLVASEPSTSAVPARWRYTDVRPLLLRAGELISAEEAERRVLILENPALPERSSITRTLYAGLQLILPGEVARCHRHTQSALRFVIEGEGAFTAVGGEKAYMRCWDLILTPNWIWHDHGSEATGPVVWLDGLDIPLVNALDASFAEYLPGRAVHPETRLPGDTLARWGANLRPVSRGSRSADPHSPLFVYPYEAWRETLAVMARDGRPDPWDGYKMEFINPAGGSSILPTISAFCQILPGGFASSSMRSTDGTVYVVVEGTGSAEIGMESFDLCPGDIFVVPAWSPRTLEASEDLVLFSYSDRATQEKLGLWREFVMRT